MKAFFFFFFFFFCFCSSLLVAITANGASGLDRYQIIIDKAPFGKAPAIVVKPPEPKPVVTGPSWVEAYRMTMLMEDNQGRPRIGLLEINENKSFTLRLDRPFEGISLKSVNYKDDSAVIVRNGDEKTIKIQIVSGTPAAAPTSPRPTPSFMRSKYVSSRKPQAPPKPPVVVKEPKYSGEELEQHLRDYQMEVLRKGLPPLPVALTPAMDNQLVEEGVLQPQEGQEGLAPPGGLPSPE
jgi:hypothetical protein